jgi:hypothetical protein
MICTKCKEEMEVLDCGISNCNECGIFAYRDFYGTAKEYNRLWNKNITLKLWMIDDMVEGVHNTSVVRRFRDCMESHLGDYICNSSYAKIVGTKLGTVKLPSKIQLEDNFYMVLINAKIDNECFSII